MLVLLTGEVAPSTLVACRPSLASGRVENPNVASAAESLLCYAEARSPRHRHPENCPDSEAMRDFPVGCDPVVQATS